MRGDGLKFQQGEGFRLDIRNNSYFLGEWLDAGTTAQGMGGGYQPWG